MGRSVFGCVIKASYTGSGYTVDCSRGVVEAVQRARDQSEINYGAIYMCKQKQSPIEILK